MKYEVVGAMPDRYSGSARTGIVCANCNRANYVTTKNKRTMAEKFEIKKFCSSCRAHHPHKEGKISKG